MNMPQLQSYYVSQHFFLQQALQKGTTFSHKLCAPTLQKILVIQYLIPLNIQLNV